MNTLSREDQHPPSTTDCRVGACTLHMLHVSALEVLITEVLQVPSVCLGRRGRRRSCGGAVGGAVALAAAPSCQKRFSAACGPATSYFESDCVSQRVLGASARALTARHARDKSESAIASVAAAPSNTSRLTTCTARTLRKLKKLETAHATSSRAVAAGKTSRMRTRALEIYVP